MKRRLTLSHLQRHDNECNCLHILTTSGYVWLTWAYPSLIVEYVFLTELVIERCKELIFLWSTPAVDWETVSWHIFVLSRLWLVSHRSVSDSHICFSNGSSSTRDAQLETPPCTVVSTSCSSTCETPAVVVVISYFTPTRVEGLLTEQRCSLV